MGCQNSIPHRVHHRDEGLPVAVAPAVVQPTAEGEGQALAPMALPVIRAVSLRHGSGVPVWPGPLELTVAVNLKQPTGRLVRQPQATVQPDHIGFPYNHPVRTTRLPVYCCVLVAAVTGTGKAPSGQTLFACDQF